MHQPREWLVRKKKHNLFEDTQVFLFIFLTFEWQNKWKNSKSWPDLVDVY